MATKGWIRALACLGAVGALSLPALGAAAQAGYPAPPTAVSGPAQPVPARSNTPSCPEPAAKSRIYADHIFQYGTLVDSPMLGTTFGMRLSESVEKVPGYPAGLFGSLNVNQLASSATVDYTQMVFDRLSFFVAASGSGITGSNVSTLLGTGVQYQYDTNGGFQAALINDHRSGDLLTLRGELGYSEGSLLGVGQLASSLISNPKATIQDVLTDGPGQLLLTPFSTLHFGGSVAYGHVFAPWFDLQTSLAAIEYDQTTEPFDVVSNSRGSVTGHEFAPNGAIALTVGGADGGFPFALQVEYRLTLAWIDGAFQTHPQNDVAAGIYYTGRPDLQLGIVGVGSWLPPLQGATPTGTTASSGYPSAFTGEFVFRYVW